jgi:3-oxoacyl-[acyl-carrier protein] reductase
VTSVRDKWGEIDTVVLNATPIQHEKTIDAYTDADFESMYRAFVMSPHYLTRAVVPEMKVRQFGRIIHVTSEVFHCGSSPFSAYVAAKGGQIGYMRSTAIELAPHGITINSVAPGWIPVERHAAVAESAKDSYLENVPVGRWGTREEVAEAVRFFAEEHSGFLTGQTLAVNGGRTLL